MAKESAAVQAGSKGIAAGLAFGSAGVLMLGLQPILLDQLVLAKRISLDQAGPLAMAEIVALGVGAGLPNALFGPQGLRRVALVASLFLVTINLLTPLAGSLLPLLGLRVGAGLAGGLLLWVASLLIVRHAHPERLAAVFLLVQTLAQASAAAFLALAAIPLAGLGGGFVALALLSVLPLLGLRVLPDTLPPLTASTESPLPPLNPRVLLAMLSVVGGLAAISGLWAFLDAIGRAAGLPEQRVQMMIAATLVAQVGGALVAGWLVPRLRARAVLPPTMLALAAVAWAFGHVPAGSLPAFAMLCEIFGFVWLFSMPFQLKLALQVEHSGRLALMVPALQLIGSALGPLVAGLLMKNDTDIATISHVAAGFAGVALCSLLRAPPLHAAAASFGAGRLDD